MRDPKDTPALAALVFDVDGTLSETEEVHRRAFNETFAAFGLPWNWDRALYRVLLKVTGGKERITHYIRDHGGSLPKGEPVEPLVARLHRDKTERYVALIDAGAAVLRPGVERLFEEALRAGVRLAIATTTSAPNVEALLKAALGARGPQLFECVAAGDMVKRKKPAPDIFLNALAALGAPAEACLAIEDSDNGLRSASAAGLPVLITPSAYTDDQDFSGALAVVADLDRAGDAVPSTDGLVHVLGLQHLMRPRPSRA
ncbi:MAG: HAD family hydrolase [Alphaproteobacteria bacterium]|nr:HAD family hydrolase [Alphaproteobacteria bacterium]